MYHPLRPNQTVQWLSSGDHASVGDLWFTANGPLIEAPRPSSPLIGGDGEVCGVADGRALFGFCESDGGVEGVVATRSGFRPVLRSQYVLISERPVEAGCEIRSLVLKSDGWARLFELGDDGTRDLGSESSSGLDLHYEIVHDETLSEFVMHVVLPPGIPVSRAGLDQIDKIELMVEQVMSTLTFGALTTPEAFLVLDDGSMVEFHVSRRIPMVSGKGSVPFRIPLNGPFNFGSFLEACATYSRVAPVVFHATNRPGAVSEHAFVSLAACLEWLAGQSYVPPVPVPAEESESQAIEEIRNFLNARSVLDSRVVRSVRARLRDYGKPPRPTLKDKIRSLLVELPDNVQSSAGLSLDTWISKYVDLRNEVAHEATRATEDVDGLAREYNLLSAEIRMVLLLLLLHRSGVGPDTLRDFAIGVRRKATASAPALAS